MLSRRKVIVATIIVLTLICIGTLLAYLNMPKAQVNKAPVLRSSDIARRVAAHYGEPHAQIIQVISTQSDSPPHDPMYIMTLTGNFHIRNHVAHYLSFSALSNKMYVWNIWGSDQEGQQGQLWDMELAPQSK